MKISELIPTLSALMRELGDAEVCIQVGKKQPLAIESISTARNVDAPNSSEKVNVAILKVLSSS